MENKTFVAGRKKEKCRAENPNEEREKEAGWLKSLFQSNN